MKDWIIKHWCMFSAIWILTLIGGAVVTCLTLPDEGKPTDTQSLILSICLGGMALQILLTLCSSILPKWYACDAMGWHKAPKVQGFDGASSNGTCPRCHKEVMQDSQGNWF
jgi:hypothetical protein